MPSTLRFQLPPRGALTPNDPLDPYRYYYAPLIGRLFAARLNLGLRLLSDLPRPDHLLEIGYGSGLLLPTLSRAADRVSGVDLRTDPARTRRHLLPLQVRPQELVRGPAQATPFPSGAFDLAVAFSLFEHLDGPTLSATFAELHRVLRPGGHLLLGCPAVHRLMSGLFVAIGFRGIDHYHISDIHAVLRRSRPWFREVRRATLPRGVPLGLALYNAVLLRREGAAGSGR